MSSKQELLRVGEDIRTLKIKRYNEGIAGRSDRHPYTLCQVKTYKGQLSSSETLAHQLSAWHSRQTKCQQGD
jgi:hypothetical protein